MTVLLRLAVLVLLVYCVQSAVPKTRQDQSQSDKNRPNEHAKSQAQVKTKRTDAKSIKIRVKRNDAQSDKRPSKSSSTKHSQKPAPKHEDKRLKNAKVSTAHGHSKKVLPSPQKKVEFKKKVEKKKTLVVKEFPLNDIIFKGRATNEANAFIKANDKVGKALELIYEHAREQDLNELEDQIRRRMTAYKR